MKNSYPVLAAALALGEFSLQDLHERTGLPLPSIDSVIRRDSRFVPLRKGEAGPRGGGQPVIYGIRESEVESITAELRELFTAIVAAGAMDNPAEGTGVPSLPDSYAAAVELIEAATKRELSPRGRQVLLEMALPNLRAAGRQLGRDGNRVSKQRLAILRGLVHAVNEAIQTPQQSLSAVQAHMQQMAETSETGAVPVEHDMPTLAQVLTAEPEWSRSTSRGSLLDPDPKVEQLMWFHMAQGRN